MRLTYTIPNLSIQDSADLESFLEGRGFEFDAAPAVESATVIVEPPTERKVRAHITADLAAEVCRVVNDDKVAGRQHGVDHYADQFNLSSSSVSRILRGEHHSQLRATGAEVGAPDPAAAPAMQSDGSDLSDLSDAAAASPEPLTTLTPEPLPQ